MKFAIAWIAACACLTQAASGQAVAVDHLSKDHLQQMAKGLESKAATSGAASEHLKEYGTDLTMLAVRTRTGGAEVHANWADIFVVLKGHGALLSGGELVNSSDNGPGEKKGDSLTDATRTVLGEGDVVHIPPAVPHQLLIDPGEPFVYFVIKVKETPPGDSR